MEAGGDEAVILPTQAIVPLAPRLPPGPYGGLLVTSANAVPFLAGVWRGPCPPVLAVGAASAKALEAAGFPAEPAPGGTGEALGARAAELYARSGLPLLYLAGRVRTHGLERALAMRGVTVHTIEVYDTVPLAPDAATLETALGGHAPDAALILSAGQATAFEALVERFPASFTPRPLALCLSQRILAHLSGDAAKTAIVGEEPEPSSLLDVYRRVRAPHG